MSKHTIWKSDSYLEPEFLEGTKAYMVEEGEEDPSDEQVMERAYETNLSYLDDECANLSKITGDYFVAIGTIVRWNGLRNGYRVCKGKRLMEAVMDTMSAFDGDNTFEVYVEDGDVKVSQLGHDNPTNPSVLTIRSVKAELIPDQFEDPEDAIYKASQAQIDARTVKYGKAVSEVYGWNEEVVA